MYARDAGISYRGWEIDSTLGPVCTFGGALNGIEATNIKDIERSKIVSCEAEAQSSTWGISQLGSVDSKLD
ncbi:MAG: hypothetical protein HY681_00915 [Chloroflexi bacterium]|nr:hypothetical protein [Chloroflexota bacterium]